MELTVDRKSFVEAVNWSTKNYDNKNDNAYVTLTVDKSGKVNLFHLNQTSFMKSSCQATSLELDDEKKGVSIAVDGVFLKKLSGVLAGNDPVTINYDGEKLIVSTNDANFTVPILNVRIPKEPDITVLGEVDDREFFDSLQRLSKLCDPNPPDQMPSIGSVDMKMDLKDKKIVLMATDRYSLGEIIIDFDPSEDAEEYAQENADIFIPLEAANLVAPSKGLTSTTTIAYEEKGGKFGYVFGDGRVVLFALTDAKPLNYSKIKDNGKNGVAHRAKIKLADFRKAIGNVSNLDWNDNDIYFTITADSIKVMDKEKKNIIKVPIEETDNENDVNVKFSRHIINESFSPISTASLNICWNAEAKLFVLEPVTDDNVIVDNVFILVNPIH